jgi:FG-GAP-like repeat/FG-GAP repeat
MRKRVRLILAAALAAVLGALLPSAAAAPSALPQQSGVVDLLEPAHLRIDGMDRGSHAAVLASGGGDVNGDGRLDVVVGTSGSAIDSGSAYVIFGGSSVNGTLDLAALGGRGFRIDGDPSGAPIRSVSLGDVNGDGRADVIVGVHTAGNNGVNSGSVYVVFGRDLTTMVNLASLGAGGFRIDGAPLEHAGASVGAVRDMNGDGRAEVVLGAPFADANRGAAFVIFGKASTTNVDLTALGDGGFRITAAPDALHAGEAVAGAGDVNGDGLPDVLVGVPNSDSPGRTRSGTAFVVFGKATTTGVDLGQLGSGGFRIDGAASFDRAGETLAGAGDVNADGRPEVLLGAPGARVSSGLVYVIFGKSSSTTVDLAALGGGGFRINGDDAHDQAGGALSGAGDVNGDGRPDVVVGARDADESGRSSSGSAWVVYGKASASDVDLGELGPGGFRMAGASERDQAGAAVTGLGDWNGDGRPDVLVGSPNASYNLRQESGAAYVVLGFGAPRLAYDPLRVKAGRRISAHAPRELARTGVPTFQATPPLPAGLGFDATGAVVGTPRAPRAETTHTVTMRDLAGQVEAPLAITVAPGGSDTTAPRLVMRAASPQRALRQKRIIVRASCNEACTLSALGSITILGRRPARVALRSASSSRLTAGQRTLSLVLTRAQLKRLSGFLAKGRRARANVTVRARDAAGNQRAATRAIVVRR